MATAERLRHLPRLAWRYAGFARQLVRDLEWHNRFSGPDFPPRGTRMFEQARLLVRSAITGEDYYNHGLYRTSLSFEEKAGFLGYFEKSRYYNTINPPVYDVIARDKALFQMLAASLDIPTPETLATTAPGHKPSFGRALDDADALGDFLAVERRSLFLKPADGSLGEGALSLGARVDDKPAWERLPTRAVISVDEVLEHVRANGGLGRFLVQRRLRPHPEMSAIVADVCPTIRLMTLTDGAPRLLGAALRLGSGSSPTDNLSGGGVVAPIDIESGRLGTAVHIDRGFPEKSKTHPVTGAQIEGKFIPHWDEIVRQAQEWARKLPFLPCIGWDIGVTDRGPVVVEINTRPRCRPLQISHDKGLIDGPLGAALARHNGTLDSGLIITDRRG